MRAGAVDMAGAIAVPAQKAESFTRASALLEPCEKYMPSAAAMARQSFSMGRAVAVRVVHGEKSCIALPAALAQRSVSGNYFSPQFIAVVFAYSLVFYSAVLNSVRLLQVKMMPLFFAAHISPFLPGHMEIIL